MPEKPGSRRPKARGTIINTSMASTISAFDQPTWAISAPSTGTMKNWPNEPAAAVTPMAQERRAAGICRPSTPNTTA
ncbi:hypothetical protein D3C78_1722130 [compost metagenome]